MLIFEFSLAIIPSRMWIFKFSVKRRRVIGLNRLVCAVIWKMFFESKTHELVESIMPDELACSYLYVSGG